MLEWFYDTRYFREETFGGSEVDLVALGRVSGERGGGGWTMMLASGETARFSHELGSGSGAGEGVSVAEMRPYLKVRVGQAFVQVKVTGGTGLGRIFAARIEEGIRIFYAVLVALGDRFSATPHEGWALKYEKEELKASRQVGPEGDVETVPIEHIERKRFWRLYRMAEPV